MTEKIAASIKEVLKISKIHPSEIDAIAIEGITTGPFPKAWQQYPGFSDMFFQWSWINKNSHGISLLNSYNNNLLLAKENNEKIF